MKKTGVWLKICLLMLCTAAMLTMTALAAEEPGYHVRGTYQQDTNTLKVEVFVRNINFSVGRFALDYDESKLSLVETGDFFTTIKADPSIFITTEGLEVSKLISKADGYLMFAFSPSGGAPIDATKSEALIAWADFQLKPDTTTADFDSSTLQMKYTPGNVQNWDSGAVLCDINSVWYKSCLAYTPPCGVNFTYVGSDKAPTDAHTIELQINDSAKMPLPATVTLQNETVTTDENGMVRFSRTNGNYSYIVKAEGYGERLGTAVVNSSDISKKVALSGNRELVEQARDKLEIVYNNGDSAAQIFFPIGLATTTLNNCKVAWTSSVPAVLTTEGGVFPKTTATNVMLTAVVSKDGQTESKVFNVTVAAKSATPPPYTPTDTENPPEPESGDKYFTDLAGFSWAEQSIMELSRAGIINGTSETTFGPRQNISRGDFLALLMRMLEPQGELGQGFTDVPKNSYYYNEITLAKAIGIATGETAELFRPQASITREDMTALTYRALVKLEYISEDTADAIALDGFSDGKSVSAHAIAAMSSMVKNGFITGNEDKTIAPTALTNRGEAAVFLYRIFLTIK